MMLSLTLLQTSAAVNCHPLEQQDKPIGVTQPLNALNLAFLRNVWVAFRTVRCCTVRVTKVQCVMFRRLFPSDTSN